MEKLTVFREKQIEFLRIPKIEATNKSELSSETMHIHPSSPSSSQSEEEDAATKIQAGFRGYRVRRQLKDSKKIKQNNLTPVIPPPSDQEKSATKIQAGFRGFLARKKISKASEAATKIQANFRGFKTRRDLKNKLKEVAKK